MKSRYLLSACAALAVAFSWAQANAQFGCLGGPLPGGLLYRTGGRLDQPVRPERTPIATVPFSVIPDLLSLTKVHFHSFKHAIR